MRRRFWSAATLIVYLVCIVFTGDCQVITAAVAGQATDVSGASVRNATIAIREIARNQWPQTTIAIAL